MANIVSSNNLTSLYGSGQTTILTNTPVPNVAGTVQSKNLTTLYSGSGNPVQAVLPYGNSNVEAFLNAGTDGANSVQNIVASGNITANYYFGNGAFLTGVSNANSANYSNIANFANFAGNVTVSSQPNITQLGNLLNLTSNGNVNFANASNVTLGSNTNVHISGGNSGYVLSTDGSSNLSWVSVNTVGIANFANFAGNVTVSNQPNITNVGTLGNLSVTGTVTSGNVSTPTVYNNGMQVQGYDYVQMQYSNAVTLPVSPYDIGVGSWFYLDPGGATWQSNTTGILKQVILGNDGTINADGNVSAPYYIGNGSQLTGIIATSGNANYANFAGNAFSVNVANVVGIGNIATINLTGNANQILYGNGVFAQVPNTATANFANYAGNVTVNAQPNITTVGNLLNLNVINATANSTQFQFVPVGTNIGLAGQNTASFVINQFNTQPGLSNQVLNMQFTASRGNATNPANVANADYIGRMAWNSWNSNTYVRNALVTVLAPQGGNVSQQANNIAWGSGSYFLNTGHPLGNITSNTALSAQNLLGWNQYGTLSLTPGTYSQGNGTVGTAISITSYGSNTDGAGQSGRIGINRQRGNRDGSLAVANTDGVGALLFSAYNGNGSPGQTGIYANVNTVSGSIANGAVVPIDVQIVTSNVASNIWTTTYSANGNVTFPTGRAVTGGFFYGDGSNLTGIIASNANFANYANYANYANIANVANSVAVANVVGIGNIATINLDGNSSNVLYGNGVFSSVPNTATANFANYAGNVTVNAQANITTVGNLLNLNIVNATANSTQFQFVPNGTNVGVSGQNTASFVINQFNTQPGTSNSQVLNMQFTASRGNATNPANVANADYIGRMAWNSYNGNTYVRNALITVLAPQGGDPAFANANVAWGAGSFFINTGNPFGNTTSNTASSPQNILSLNRYGLVTINPGAPGPNSAAQNTMLLQSYGSNTDGAGGLVNRISFQRSRGNRDGATAVANNDGAGGLTFTAYNGSTYNGGAVLNVVANTNGGSVTSGVPVPLDLLITTQNTNSNSYTTTFYATGNVSFPTTGTVTANNFAGNGSGLTNLNVTTLANVATGGVLTLGTTGAGAPQFNINGDATPNSALNVYNAQSSYTLDGVNPTTGFSPFRFSVFNNSYTQTLPIRLFRSRGTSPSPLPVIAGDQVADINFAVYADTGNTYYNVGDLAYTIASNDGAGNVTVNARLQGPSYNGIGSNLAFGFSTTSANIFIASVVDPGLLKLHEFYEQTYNIGTVSGTPTIDLNLGSIQKMTINGNITLNSLANVNTGSSATIIINQDSGGNHTLSSTWKFAGGYKTLSTAPFSTDIISVFYDGATYYASLTTGYV